MSTSKIIIIDNYDSFTYNLVQIVEELTSVEPVVVRNDQIQADELDAFDYILLSPGPGIPSEAGNLLDIIKQNSKHKKIFGVCLGLQAIAEVFDSQLLNLGKVYHGIQTSVHKTNIDCPILAEIPESFEAGRYHSWVVDPEHLGSDLVVTSTDANKQIMSARHKTLQVYGVQFHPESILTPLGSQMIQNFLNIN